MFAGWRSRPRPLRQVGTWALAGLVFCLGGVALLADEPSGEPYRVVRDVTYAGEHAHPRQRLDLYAPASGSNRPVVVWIHGGGWRRGDKGSVGEKPRALTEAGYLLASVNYRLVPEVTFREQADDLALAITWLADHAAEFGGDGRRLFLMGHSAGAHLAALVATDGAYLAKRGRTLNDLAGVVLLDGAGYDVAAQIERGGPRSRAFYEGVFGKDPEALALASPRLQVKRDQGTPPFLICHVAERADSERQSRDLAQTLVEAGVPARVVPCVNKTHATINQELGQADDPVTREVLDFLANPRANTGRSVAGPADANDQ